MIFILIFSNFAQRNQCILIVSAKEEEALNQPPDENYYDHQYTPVNVKINKVDDV